MILLAREDCESLSIAYDEESLATTDTTRERVRLLQVMQSDIKKEQRRIRSLRQRWEDHRSQQSPGEDESLAAASDSTEHTTNAPDSNMTHVPAPTTVTPGEPVAMRKTDNHSLQDMDFEQNDATNLQEGPRGGKCPAARDDQAHDDSRGVHGEVGQPLHHEQSSAAGLTTGGAGS